MSCSYLSMAESMEATDVLNPALNYGIMVDCGSSGSRVFVYYWPPHNGNPHTLLDIRQMKDREHKPVVKKIKPGEEEGPELDRSVQQNILYKTEKQTWRRVNKAPVT